MIDDKTLDQWQFESNHNEAYSEGQRIRILIQALRHQTECLREQREENETLLVGLMDIGTSQDGSFLPISREAILARALIGKVKE